MTREPWCLPMSEDDFHLILFMDFPFLTNNATSWIPKNLCTEQTKNKTQHFSYRVSRLSYYFEVLSNMSLGFNLYHPLDEHSYLFVRMILLRIKTVQVKKKKKKKEVGVSLPCVKWLNDSKVS